MYMKTFVPIHPIGVKIFHRINENFDLMVAVNEKSGGHMGLQGSPVETMNVCKCGNVASLWIQ